MKVKAQDMYIGPSYWAMVFFLHFSIMTAYFATTSYLFVVGKEPNPIGIGFLQLLLILAHIIFTAGFFSYLGINAPNKKMNRKKGFVNIGVILLSLIIYTPFQGIIWKWLWSIR